MFSPPADVFASFPRAALQYGARARAASASRAPQYRASTRIVSALEVIRFFSVGAHPLSNRRDFF